MVKKIVKAVQSIEKYDYFDGMKDHVSNPSDLINIVPGIQDGRQK